MVLLFSLESLVVKWTFSLVFSSSSFFFFFFSSQTWLKQPLFKNKLYILSYILTFNEKKEKKKGVLNKKKKKNFGEKQKRARGLLVGGVILPFSKHLKRCLKDLLKVVDIQKDECYIPSSNLKQKNNKITNSFYFILFYFFLQRVQ